MQSRTWMSLGAYWIASACALAQVQDAPGAPVSAPAAAPAKPAEPAAPIGERRLAPIQKFIQFGNGPITLILIPDAGFNAGIWTNFMQRNGDKYRMFAVTLPGFGGTQAPELRDGEDWEAMAISSNAVRALAFMIQERAFDRPIIVGHGYGGHLAMWFALEHPELTRAIVSIDGLPVAPLADPNQDDSLGARRLIVREALAPKMAILTDQEWHDRHYANAFSLVTDGHKANDLAKMLGEQDRGVYMFMLFEAILSDLRPRLKDMKVPMLCIAPVTPDPVPPPVVIYSTWNNYLGAPPGASLVFYPNCRHFVMEDNPEQLDRDLALFVAGKDVPGALKASEIIPITPDPMQDNPRPLPDYREIQRQKEKQQEQQQKDPVKKP